MTAKYWRKLYFKEHLKRVQAEQMIKKYESMNVLQTLAELECENQNLRQLVGVHEFKGLHIISCVDSSKPVIKRVES